MRRTAKSLPPAPKSFHLDKRAAQILGTPIMPSQPSDDELMTAKATALWLGVSGQWLGVRRARGDGPPFEKISTRVVRYRRDKVRKWLDQKSHRSISEYKERA